MSTLHTVNKSPFSHQTLASCLTLCASGDSILLLEDGTYGALTGAPTTALLNDAIKRGVSVYAIKDDLAARGLHSQLIQQITATTYQGFVRLSCQHKNTQSWY